MNPKSISDKSDIIQDNRFTGPVSMNTIDNDSQDFRVLYVRFLDGARTFVQHHTTDQILIAQEGQGILVYLEKINGTYKQKETIHLKPGDSVRIPKEIPHYHGSNSKDSPFGHIAVLKKDTETIWDYEKSYPLE